jgi:apoptosis-inducing factor 2
VSTLLEMNVQTILGERLDLAAPPKTVVNDEGVPERVVRTQSGKEIQAGVVVR